MAEIKKFEDALKELESIVKKLEGDLPLDNRRNAYVMRNAVMSYSPKPCWILNRSYNNF